MGALTIAFDTTIVGALALPWVLIIVHLFYFEGENRLAIYLRWIRRQQLTAVAGVVLFALAYTLGSAASRFARDFFNDDDLHISDYHLRPRSSNLKNAKHFIVRNGVTEDRILAKVYCETAAYFPSETNTALQAAINDFGSRVDSPQRHECNQILSWAVHLDNEALHHDKTLNESAEDVFGFEEAAVLLKGEDATLRLRQLHDQVMVLRGAAFNGVIVFALCIFAWAAALRREPKATWMLYVLQATPALCILAGLVALYHHVGERAPSDPPYMEFTLLLLGAIGAKLAWGRSWLQQSERTLSAPAVTHVGKAAKSCWRKQEWSQIALLSLILTAAAFLGWWATQVVYAQQVIYSYGTQGHIAAEAGVQGSSALEPPAKDSPSKDARKPAASQ